MMDWYTLGNQYFTDKIYGSKSIDHRGSFKLCKISPISHLQTISHFFQNFSDFLATLYEAHSSSSISYVNEDSCIHVTIESTIPRHPEESRAESRRQILFPTEASDYIRVSRWQQSYGARFDNTD